MSRPAFITTEISASNLAVASAGSYELTDNVIIYGEYFNGEITIKENSDGVKRWITLRDGIYTFRVIQTRTARTIAWAEIPDTLVNTASLDGTTEGAKDSSVWNCLTPQAGEYMQYSGLVAPRRFISCDGSVQKKYGRFARLGAILEPNDNSENLHLPDARARFLRSYELDKSASTTEDPIVDKAINASTGSNQSPLAAVEAVSKSNLSTVSNPADFPEPDANWIIDPTQNLALVVEATVVRSTPSNIFKRIDGFRYVSANGADGLPDGNPVYKPIKNQKSLNSFDNSPLAISVNTLISF